MTIYTATTTAQAQAYIAAARGGDTIQLAPGTYDGLRLSNINKGSAVLTIISQDADNPAVLTNFSADRINAMKFTNLEFFITSDSSLSVTNSHVLTFDNIDVHGTLNGTSSDDYRGMLMKNSSYVTISNSHFHELTDAFNPIGNQVMTITGNTFDLLRDDGIAGGGNSQITISNNLFTNFDHVGLVHPDAIQFWTVGTTASAYNITIKGNVIDRGTGTAIQGIFLNDELGTLPYRNVSITDNVVVGELYNGIGVFHATNAVLSGNTVIGAADQQSWIGLFNVASAQLDDNVASSFNLSTSTVVGHGDVLATSLPLQDDGSYLSPFSDDPTLSPRFSAMEARANSTLVDQVNLLGFTDGNSRFGHTYSFAVIEIDGTDGDDRLSAGATGSFHLYGFDGNDSLVANRTATANVLEGGTGNDSYTIYKTSDVVIEAPDEGSDSIYAYVSYTMPANAEYMRAMAAGLTLTGGSGNDSLVAHSGGSILNGLDGDDVLQGGAGSDRLYGGDGNDRISGGSGNDTINGGADNDTLNGNEGNDTILGGDGNDYIEGGLGADILTGGAGSDTFGYRTADFVGGAANNRDIIADFNVAEGDKIALTMVDANANTAAMDRFTFIGSQAFHGVAGELRWALDGDGITVYGDTNGDRVANIAIHLTGLTSITQSSFVI